MGLTAMTARAEEIGVDKFGLYVVASDLNDSREFYQSLFGKQPYVVNDRLVGFDLAGGLFAVFAAQAADRKIDFGNSAVPYLRVKDVDREFERMRTAGVKVLDDAVVREGAIALFRIADPDGNVIEFFSIGTTTKNQ